jgi:hypothetical protein
VRLAGRPSIEATLQVLHFIRVNPFGGENIRLIAKELVAGIGREIGVTVVAH